MNQHSWLDEATKETEDALRKHGREKLAAMYRNCFRSTWDTTLTRDEKGVFLITGDIPAMWLRDSSAQVYHYLPFARRFPEVRETVAGLIRRQMGYVVLNPYANAFNRTASSAHGYSDTTSWNGEQSPYTWENKYEVDSLCYPIRLAYAYWKATGETDFADEGFRRAAETILEVWRTEQHHEEESPYYFVRSHCPPSDTLSRAGKGSETAYTGMTWSGFRPSDDACRYGYLVPSNLFAARSLLDLSEMAKAILADEKLAGEALALREDILGGVRRYGIVDHLEFGRVYAYEVDGLGHAHFMDDANVPSLLSLPYLRAVDAEDPVYLNTRRMVLSPANPYYYEGKAARGIGSPHTPEGFIWPISLCMQGLTSCDREEILSLLDTLEGLDAGTGLMHEGVCKDDPETYTRPWFAWANSLFSEFVEKAVSVL